MFEPRLLTALAAGSTAVTPNNRLARALVAAYDRQQRANGRRAWRAARAMPWSAWLEQLWSDVVAYDALPSLTRLVRGPQARWVWREIVARGRGAPAEGRGAAALAPDAWAPMRTWGSRGEGWRAG